MKKKIFLAGMLVFLTAAWGGFALQEQQAEPQPATTSTLVIEEGVICTGVVDRVPQGAAEVFTPDVGKLICFTKVSGAAPGTVIKHLWYRAENLLHTQELAIGGSPWRTWSSKTVSPDMTGEWKVEIRDADDNLVTTLNFAVQ
jgi:hypothetical protein